MDTYIAYFDETGDDGITTASSSYFILTSLYMPASSWQSNFDIIKSLRMYLKRQFGFHLSQEMHTKDFLTDKNPYRNYGWNKSQKQEILKDYILAVCKMDVSVINVIIDKTKIKTGQYSVLENALKYNIQRIDNDSNSNWNYIIITDNGRIAPMRKTARAIRAYNPIQSKYSFEFSNRPIKGLIEDILEKDSRQSHFIQLSDFISYFVNLCFKAQFKKEPLPNRVLNVIDDMFVRDVMDKLKSEKRLNLRANKDNPYGFVVYPR